nr:IS1595 family transposase [Candidatus Erwinia dacicola]
MPAKCLFSGFSSEVARFIPDAKSQTLLPVIESKIYPDSIVYTDNFASYDLLDVSDFKHYRINHSTQFTNKKDRQNHINGIENFGNQAKRHMRKFNGIPKAHFKLYLKECEWRLNTLSEKQKLIFIKQMVKSKI